jgi:hypothetical protein
MTISVSDLDPLNPGTTAGFSITGIQEPDPDVSL